MSDRSERLVIAVVVTVVAVIVAVIGVSVVWWNNRAYDDIRRASEAWVAPEEWTLVSFELDGSKRITLYTSDIRDATYEYQTSESGPDACRSGAEALVALSGLEVTDNDHSPGNFCAMIVRGDIHGVTRAFIYVQRVWLGGMEYGDEVARIIVVLREDV